MIAAEEASAVADREAPAAATRARAAGWIAIALLAAAPRLVSLTDQIPRGDQWHSLVRVSQDGFRAIASTFGVVDHCIPLTLYLEAVDRLFGIDERFLYLPGTLLSLALAVALPLLFASGGERTGATLLARSWAILLAAAPALVVHARSSRPYGFTTLLAPLAVLFWARWRSGRRRVDAAAYVACTGVVAWSLPPHLPFCLAPFLLPSTLSSLRKPDERRSILGLGAAVTAVLLILLAPPLWLGWSAIGFRVSAAPALPAPFDALRALVGMGDRSILALLVALAALGALFAWRERASESARVTGVLAFAALLQIASLLVARPFGSDNRVVFARYALPAAPLLLLAAAWGIRGLLSKLPRPGIAVPAAALALATSLFFASHLRTLFRLPNNFGDLWLGGLPNARERLVHGESPELVARLLPAGYEAIRREPAGSAPVVEAPYTGLISLPYRHFQRMHRQPVIGGLLPRGCTTGGNGIGDGLTASTARDFRHLVDALDRAAVRRRGARWLVLHREPAAAPGRRDAAGAVEGVDYAACRERLLSIYGAESFRDDAMSVWDLSPATPSPATG